MSNDNIRNYFDDNEEVYISESQEENYENNYEEDDSYFDDNDVDIEDGYYDELTRTQLILRNITYVLIIIFAVIGIFTIIHPLTRSAFISIFS